MLLRARVSLLDRPGALLAVAKVIADLGGNIVDIEILAASDGRVIDDLLVDMPAGSQDTLVNQLATAHAEVLSLRRTVRLSGQRPDLDLLGRIASEPAAALATLVSLAPPIWSADWALVIASASGEIVRSSPGAPTPAPAGLPVPLGPLPRRALVDGTAGGQFEVVGTRWGGEHQIYLGRIDGPTFLQVEMVQLRRILELATNLARPT
ncbi:MAG TPA: ACT domain-containing protein [Mycobacteriales bacterium]|nr:ACT domain-containing protein [Mycobacteriales bacterium]